MSFSRPANCRALTAESPRRRRRSSPGSVVDANSIDVNERTVLEAHAASTANLNRRTGAESATAVENRNARDAALDEASNVGWLRLRHNFRRVDGGHGVADGAKLLRARGASDNHLIERDGAGLQREVERHVAIRADNDRLLLDRVANAPCRQRVRPNGNAREAIPAVHIRSGREARALDLNRDVRHDADPIGRPSHGRRSCPSAPTRAMRWRQAHQVPWMPGSGACDAGADR